MAKFTPGKITDEEVQIDGNEMKLNLTIQSKTFSTGKKGFFRQGSYTTPDGKKYRLNIQAFETK